MRTILKKQAINHEDFDLSLSHEKKIQRPNIDHLIKRIINERRQRKKTNIISLGTALLSFTLIFYFFQN